MKNKAPDLEIIDSVLNEYFLDTETGGWAEEDEIGTVYIYNADGSIYAVMPTDTWFELLNYKEDEVEVTINQ